MAPLAKSRGQTTQPQYLHMSQRSLSCLFWNSKLQRLTVERPPWNHRPVPNPTGKVAEIRKKMWKVHSFLEQYTPLCLTIHYVTVNYLEIEISGKTPPYYCFYVCAWFKNKRVWTEKIGKKSENKEKSSEEQKVLDFSF